MSDILLLNIDNLALTKKDDFENDILKNLQSQNIPFFTTPRIKTISDINNTAQNWENNLNSADYDASIYHQLTTHISDLKTVGQKLTTKDLNRSQAKIQFADIKKEYNTTRNLKRSPNFLPPSMDISDSIGTAVWKEIAADDLFPKEHFTTLNRGDTRDYNIILKEGFKPDAPKKPNAGKPETFYELYQDLKSNLGASRRFVSTTKSSKVAEKFGKYVNEAGNIVSQYFVMHNVKGYDYSKIPDLNNKNGLSTKTTSEKEVATEGIPHYLIEKVMIATWDKKGNKLNEEEIKNPDYNPFLHN
jgi:hypothetical protein